jgi:hypothetical protein
MSAPIPDLPLSHVELEFLLKLAHGPSLPVEINDQLIETLAAVLGEMKRRVGGNNGVATEPGSKRTRKLIDATTGVTEKEFAMNRPCHNPKKLRRRARIAELNDALRHRRITPIVWSMRINALTSRIRARKERSNAR